jgi:hypothetical protein
MIDQEKAAIVQFLGTMHAHAKKVDEAVVERAPTMTAISKNFQHELQNVIATPAVNHGMGVMGVPGTPIPQPQPVVQHTFAPPMQVHHTTTVESSPQLEFDFTKGEKQELLDLLRRIDKNLSKLINHITNDKQPSDSKQGKPDKGFRLSSITK